MDKVNKENQDEIVDTPETLNVLIIGVDEGGFDNSRSDVMIIASIDFETKTVKLTSVMRDTLAHIPTSNTYQKLNHSYMEGGAKETMLAINTNFDLNIEDYVVFDYDAVKKVVDFVGGYPVDVSAGEARDMGISTGHHSFPFNYEGKILSDKLWYAVPKTMRTNVMDLHKNIYNSYDYVPSDVVNHISEIIKNKSNVHLY